MITEKVKFVSAGSELVGELNMPDKFSGKLPSVVLFHGTTNSRQDCPLIKGTAEALVNAGFITFRFDFFGSGESPGLLGDKTIFILEQNAKDSIDFIVEDARVDSKRLGMWGRSLGGTLACLLPRDARVKARVAASPGVFFEKEFKAKFGALKQKQLELEKLGKNLPGTGAYKGSFDFKPTWFESLNGLDERLAKNLTSLDTVLVLGTALDCKVTPDQACIVMNEVRDPKRIWIYPCDHDYAGFEKGAVQESVVWFKKYL